MNIVDPFRYGMFTYRNPEEIGDRRIRRWMPPKAADIVVHKTSDNHLAQFTIDQEAFLDWLPQICNEYPFCKKNTDPRKTGGHRSSVDEFNRVFKEVDWHFPEDSVMYGMTLSSNGAGFTIWYSEALHTAYLEAGYW
ncbi:hypothetical protein VU04_06100 [Desulfobulbus sp. TB]|nr:hypothetical protein [Desulfobulbus sp. TB]